MVGNSLTSLGLDDDLHAAAETVDANFILLEVVVGEGAAIIRFWSKISTLSVP